jgi:hypothetical protein
MQELPPSDGSFPSTADKGLVLYGGVILSAVLLFFVIYAAIKGQSQWGGTLAFLFLAGCICCICLRFFVDTSELLVSDVGLARKIGHSVCMHVPWSGIKSIREKFRKPSSDRDDGPQIIIQVVPSVRSGVILHFRRMLVITDQVEGFDELIEILNARIEEHSIRVEINTNGIWNKRPRLVATPEP